MTTSIRDAAAATGDVLARAEGALGHLTLNRPAAINALTLPMIRSLQGALDRWRHAEQINCVLIDGAGERGLCAGGDIVALHDAARSGDPTPARTFWQEEYRLNATIARYPKPVVAFMDGVVMGGGVGLSAHASDRLATERLTLAMPEVAIGFAPDVGATFLLSRLPGEIGTHLALTGARLGAADAVLCGLADSVVARDDLARIADDLRDGDVDAALKRTASPPNGAPSTLPQARPWIDACYSAGSVEDILERLRGRCEPTAGHAADAIAGMSPTALKVTLSALRRARSLPSLEACLRMELRISCAFLEVPDFVEGIRAAVIDKDRNPRWSPATLRGVTPEMVERHFAEPRMHR